MHCARDAGRVEVLRYPPIQNVAGMLADEGTRQIRQFFIRIAERVEFRVFLEWIFGQSCFEMFQCDAAVETKLGRGTIEDRDRDGVVEGIVQPADMGRIRCDFQARFQKPEVVAFPRAEHHPVFAKLHWFRVSINREMPHGQKGHISLLDVRYITLDGICTTSSVQTLKLVRVFAPKVVAIATSHASRPRASSTRPILGTLLRASNVCHRPPR